MTTAVVEQKIGKAGSLEKAQGRIDWIDALKFIGIFFIYIAHFVESSGKICLYAYAFHVPLFFFIAGFFALRDKGESFFCYVLNKAKTLLLPYCVFGLLTIVVRTLQVNYVPISFKEIFSDLLMGMRNQMFASPLWFFPCLFVVEVLFEGMRRLFKNKAFIFVACVILFFAAEKFFYQDYVVLSRWWFSSDTALYYLLYYAVGAVSFGKLSKFSYREEKAWKKVLAGILFLVTAVVAFVVFFEKQARIKSVFALIPFGDTVFDVLVAFALILFHIVIAKQLVRFPLLCEIGRNTLWLCGNEVILKTVVPIALSTFGLYYSLNSPLHTVIYSFVLLVLAVKVVIPVEKKLLGKVFEVKRK